MPFDSQKAVTDLICLWGSKHSPTKDVLPRVNLRLIFGTPELASDVRQKLESASSAKTWYLVRTSADSDAVTCRNNRPATMPPGVTERTQLRYFVFWLPSLPGHEKNKESLADLRATTCWDLLADAKDFVLPQEQEIEDRCTEAAKAWEKSELAAKHLRSAWAAVRTCIRENRGGREGSVPFFPDLAAYVNFLDRATIPSEQWAQIEPAKKASRLIEQWGNALPALSLFHIPELASLLGITTDPNVSISKREMTETWSARFTEILAENLEAAADFSQLSDKIAGNSSVSRQLDALVGQVPLCRGDSRRKKVAREALEKFCQDGDPNAYEVVDWQFREDASNRNSRSFGLRGILIARRTTVRVPAQDRAIQETLELLQSLLPEGSADSGALEPFFEKEGQAAAKDPVTARRIADLTRSIASRQVPEWVTDSSVRDILGRIARADGLSAPALDRVAARWDKLAGDEEDAVAQAPTLLLGLARLCAARLSKDTTTCAYFPGLRPSAGEKLVLRVQLVSEGRIPSLELPVDRWDEATRERIRLWLRDSVVPGLYPDEDDENDTEEGEACEMQIEVRREGGGQPTPLGWINISWSPSSADLVAKSAQGLSSWNMDDTVTANSDPALLRRLFEEPPRNESCPEGVAKACQAYRKACGDTVKNWSVTALTGPTPSLAREWVNAWSDAIDLGDVGAPNAAELMAKAEEAFAGGQTEEGRRLMKQAHSLMTSDARSSCPTVDGIKGLLRVCTGSFGLTRLVLTPHHPLVLRLRLVGDEILIQILKKIWSDGWPEPAVEELEDALADWGPPEPVQFYGWWTGQTPLSFEGWARNGGFAWFGGGASKQTVGVNSPGVREVAYDARRYRELFPMAADRLRIRVRADVEGRWAARVLDGVLQDGGPLRADIDLETDLPPDIPSAVESAWQQEYDLRCSLEMSDDGTVPRVRIRRRSENDRGQVHLNLVLGDMIDVFGEQHLPVKPREARFNRWDPSVLFTPPRPELRPNRFVVGDPPDELCRRVGLAVGYAFKESRDQVFVRQCAFDPAVVRRPLEQLHDGTHWLVLASRQPLHRAVQQAGEEVARLLDFRTVRERGRTAHVCVSVGTKQFTGDLARLEGMLRILTGETGSIGSSFVHAARRFAPRLALSSAGASSLIEIEGLLGLLLTQEAVKEDSSTAILLALDQHRGLLAGRGGRRGDIIRLRFDKNKVWIGVMESKLSRRTVTNEDQVIDDAREQLLTTRERLKHFTAQHPLVPRVRAELALALIDQIHLSEVSPERSDELMGFLDAATNSSTQIELEPETEAIAHVWSLAAETVNETLVKPNAPRVYVHAREDTLRRFRDLIGTSRAIP
jgi:hypothetical protein